MSNKANREFILQQVENSVGKRLPIALLLKNHPNVKEAFDELLEEKTLLIKSEVVNTEQGAEAIELAVFKEDYPIYHKTMGSAGADVPSAETVTIQPGEQKIIPSILSVVGLIDPNRVVLISPRSSFYGKYKLILTNSVGLIDSDYPDKVGFLYANLGDEPVTIEAGTDLGQATVLYVDRSVFPTAFTKRTGGIGSTDGEDQAGDLLKEADQLEEIAGEEVPTNDEIQPTAGESGNSEENTSDEKE